MVGTDSQAGQAGTRAGPLGSVELPGHSPLHQVSITPATYLGLEAHWLVFRKMSTEIVLLRGSIMRGALLSRHGILNPSSQPGPPMQGVPHGQQEHRKATVHPASLQTRCFSCCSGEDSKVSSRETMGGPATEDDDPNPWMLPMLVAPHPGPGEWPQDSPHICSSSFTHARNLNREKTEQRLPGKDYRLSGQCQRLRALTVLTGPTQTRPGPFKSTQPHSDPTRPA